MKRPEQIDDYSRLPPQLRDAAARDRHAEQALQSLLANETMMAHIRAIMDEAQRGVRPAPWRQLRGSVPPYLAHAAALHERARAVAEGIYASETTMAQIRDAMLELERGVPLTPWRQVRQEARRRDSTPGAGRRNRDVR